MLKLYVNCVSCLNADLSIAHTSSRWLLTVDTRVRSLAGPYEVCGTESGGWIGVSPSTWVFPCQDHSTIAHRSEYSDIYFTDVGAVFRDSLCTFRVSIYLCIAVDKVT